MIACLDPIKKVTPQPQPFREFCGACIKMDTGIIYCEKSMAYNKPFISVILLVQKPFFFSLTYRSGRWEQNGRAPSSELSSWRVREEEVVLLAAVAAERTRLGGQAAQREAVAELLVVDASERSSMSEQ